MADAESIRQIAHSRAPLSTWLGVVLLFALFGVIVLAVIGPLPRSSDYEETRAKKRMETLKTVRDDAEKSLATYAWVDKSKGVARVPISRAMELTTAELPAGPIATPQEQAQPAPASPAPAGSPKAGATQPAGSPSTTAPATSAAPASPAAASPSAQTPASPAPAAQTSPAATASPAPAKTP